MICFRNTEIGIVAIEAVDGLITRLEIYDKNKDVEKSETCPEIEEAFKQLDEYLKGKRTEFNLRLNPEGTPFMKSVWQALLKIPYGKTASYKDVAIACGNSKAVRAVGSANNKNPIPIFIPCHRVVGSNGRLVGYAYGLNFKKFLLNLEKLNKTTKM